MAQNRLKMGRYHLYVHPKSRHIIFWEKLFDPFCDPYVVGDLVSRRFGIFRGPNRATTGFKTATTTYFGIPNGLGCFS